MLPLWIIDVTSDQSNRRAEFIKLVGEVDHVYIPEELKVKTDTNSESQESNDSDGSNSYISLESEKLESERNEFSSNKTIEEELDEADKDEAHRNAKIEGNYWYYSSINNWFVDEVPSEPVQDSSKDTSIEDSQKQETERKAQQLYQLQEQIVNAGKDFIRTIRKSNAKPFQPVNVIVLGDATEDLTQMIFPSVAAILRKEKGRFLPAHIHQGCNIFGSLFVPCDINSREVGERVRILHLLDEIEVQHNVSSFRGYDHMMLYQDVQNRTECEYPMLDDKQQAEYLLQCLVHLFFACDIHHPLISGTASEDTFYFSMGAASVYFDMEMEDANDINIVACNLLNNFKDEGDNKDDSEDNIVFLDKELYQAGLFVREFNKLDEIDVLNVNVDSPKPHPINDFLKKTLKRLYYHYYLRYFPANLLRKIMAKIEENTGEILDRISAKSQKSFESASLQMYPGIRRLIKSVNENVGALCRIELELKEMQECLSKEKERISSVLENDFWYDLMFHHCRIPKKLLGYFEEYHDTFTSDVSVRNGGAGCEGMKTETTTKLREILAKEKTLLSTMGRCFFAGIMCVLCFMPILDFLSPSFIDLGDMKKNAFLWGLILFMIPVLIQLISYFIYLNKRSRLVNRLKAYYMHDGYARLANRIEFEADEFYDKMIRLCEEYLNRCGRIRKDVKFKNPLPERHSAIPRTMFNQPLNGGSFNDWCLVPEKEVASSMIRINGSHVEVTKLKKSQYYYFINYFCDEFKILFSDVSLPENHIRRYDEDAQDFIFVDAAKLEKEREENWNYLKDKFRKEICKSIKKEMLPRKFPTVGDKVDQYCRKINKPYLLEPVAAFAACNGEIICDADSEYADIKSCHQLDALRFFDLPLFSTKWQVSKHDELYKKYLFFTRWRCFEHFSYNRILPIEDFDQSVREVRVYSEEVKAKSKKAKAEEKRRKRANGIVEEESPVEEQNIAPYKPCYSSLILWATCPDENSSEWLKLFDANHFGRAYNDRNIFREKLNQND